MEQLLLFVLIAYLIGAIPFGLILSKVFLRVDVRTIGSNSTGATNVLRLGNKWVALATMILDIGKVYVAWIAVQQLIIHTYGPFAASIILGIYELQLKMIVSAAAVIGHCFPVYCKFRGGKGVAAAAGALILFSPWLFAATFATWLLVLAVFGKSSLAALLTGALTPVYVLVLRPYPLPRDNNDLMWFVIALMLFIIVRHISNIKRLIAGTESNVVINKKTEPAPAEKAEKAPAKPAKSAKPAARVATSKRKPAGKRKAPK